MLLRNSDFCFESCRKLFLCEAITRKCEGGLADPSSLSPAQTRVCPGTSALPPTSSTKRRSLLSGVTMRPVSRGNPRWALSHVSILLDTHFPTRAADTDHVIKSRPMEHGWSLPGGRGGGAFRRGHARHQTPPLCVLPPLPVR